MRTSIGFALTLVILSSTACHRTKAVSLDQGLASNRVWVTMSNESVVALYGPKIYGNKLVGYVDGKYGEYPIASVKKVHVRQANHAGTAALIAAGIVTFAGFTYAIAGSGNEPADPYYCDLPEHVDELPCQE